MNAKIKDIGGYRWYIDFLVRYNGKIESFALDNKTAENNYLARYDSMELVTEYMNNFDTDKSIKIYEDSSIHYVDISKNLIIVLAA